MLSVSCVMWVNMFVWLIVFLMHFILYCDAVRDELSCIRINQVKRRLHYVCICVCTLGCLFDALKFELRCSRLSYLLKSV